jgi:hypothetical protein
MTKEEILQGLSEHYEWTDREQQRIEEKMDEYYNQAIDDAIEEMRKWYIERHDSTFEYYFREQINPRLNQLKKP